MLGLFGSKPASSPGEMKSWLDFAHPEYLSRREAWWWALSHYEATVLEPGSREAFLVRKLSAETIDAFSERAALADYTPHFSLCVDSLAGMLFQAEDQANRYYGDDKNPGLGSPDDDASAFYPVYHNADGMGAAWPTIWKKFTLSLILTRRAWCVVTPNATGQPRIRLWPVTAVDNWLHDGDRLVEVKIKHVVDTRTSIKQQASGGERWTVYDREGWQTWRKDEKGKEVADGDKHVYTIPLVDPDGEPALPIFMISMPIDREVGYMAARKANAIFNKESELDHLLRTAHFPYLVIPGTDEFFDKVIAGMAQGLRALQSDPDATRDPSFIAPSHEGAKTQDERLRRKVEEFYITFFRQYGDAAREKTATEIKQDVSAGVGAYLELLKSAVDDGENQALWRVAQYLLPGKTEQWFNNRVNRSSEFGPIDIPSLVTALSKRYFGEANPVPLGITGLVNVAKQLADYDGVEVNEDELRTALQLEQLQRLADVFSSLPTPPAVKAKMALAAFKSLGFLDEESGGGEDLLTEIEDMADAEEEAKRRMSEPLYSDGEAGPGAPPRGGGRFPPKPKTETE